MTALTQSIALGPMVLSLNQLLIGLALSMALLTSTLVGSRRGESASDTLFNTLLIGIVAARLVFVTRYHADYASVWAMFDIRDGGFDTLGGVVAGSAYVCWRLWRAPRQRVVLASAVLTGALAWSVAAGSLLLIDNQVRSLPKTQLATLDHRPITLTALAERADQPMVVNLWATWCPPCRREMPILAAAQRARDDITFVFVNQGEYAARVKQYLKNESLELSHVWLDPGQALGRAVGSQAMPTTLFYDADGRLRDSHLGALSRASLSAKLEQLY
ncbi:Thiol-disulfide isomerase or thioredoxin [Modicisalibacter muralis]|uniref:Thiol-disulfide isomerase or thioredoxin n=1 Tax=Modicisalibacter muralis TaxID=119000 RepID=A0A1G9IY70_9GAMM|nr:TlpA disulfide reductase family protein [Halomonas muralis]SDL30041.1 Thiol-disulfide isomerase or thioredoxin [Halomonas muralis]